MVFERDMEMLAPGYTQTLEPRAQYLYVPYRDQSKIYNYDSSLLQSDYSGLFGTGLTAVLTVLPPLTR